MVFTHFITQYELIVSQSCVHLCITYLLSPVYIANIYSKNSPECLDKVMHLQKYKLDF